MVFLINGLSYFAVLLALLAMRLDPRPPKEGPVPPFRRHFAEGVRYAFGFAPIRAILLLMGLVSLAGFPFVVLLPVFATDLLHGGPRTLGFLVAAQGAGALAGALHLAARRTLQGLGTLIVRAVTLFGLGLMAFALTRHVGLAMGLLFLAGFGMMVQLASCNTILQTVLEDGKRGRVMSLYRCPSAACSSAGWRAVSGPRRRWSSGAWSAALAPRPSRANSPASGRQSGSGLESCTSIGGARFKT